MRTDSNQMNKTANNFYADAFWNETLPKLLAAGAGGGVALRSGMGLGELLNHNLRPVPKTPEPTTLNIPYRPLKVDEEIETKKPRRGMSLLKEADDTPNTGLQWLSDLFTGQGAKSQMGVPMAWPAAVLGTGAAGVGGYKLTDMLMQSRKKKMVEEELGDAKSDYQQALMQQFSPMSGAKVKQAELVDPVTIASLLTNTTTEVGKDFEKLATLADDAGGLGRFSLGAYMTLAPLLALGTGAATHHYLKAMGSGKNDEAEALRSQINDRASRTPPEVFANLTPVDESGRTIDMAKRRNQRMYGINDGTHPGEEVKAAEAIEAKAAAFVNEFLYNKKASDQTILHPLLKQAYPGQLPSGPEMTRITPNGPPVSSGAGPSGIPSIEAQRAANAAKMKQVQMQRMQPNRQQLQPLAPPQFLPEQPPNQFLPEQPAVGAAGKGLGNNTTGAPRQSGGYAATGRGFNRPGAEYDPSLFNASKPGVPTPQPLKPEPEPFSHAIHPSSTPKTGEFLYRKKADDEEPGSKNLNVYSNMPVQSRREKLSPEEDKNIEEGKNRWLPQIFEDYATKPHNMMSSPLKGGLLTALAGAGVGGLAGAGIGGLPGAGIGALAGGAAGIPLGALSAFSRNQTNNNVEEMMRRNRPGASLRDLRSDPIYNQDMQMSRMHNMGAPSMLSYSPRYTGDTKTESDV